jgi:hypothetical protein
MIWFIITTIIVGACMFGIGESNIEKLAKEEMESEKNSEDNN